MGFTLSKTARNAALAVPCLVAAAVGTGALLRRPPALAGAVEPADPVVAPLPATLAETGLYADAGSRTIAAANLPFTPQYPLWTDGATKQRWIYLPPGSAIDARDPDAWQFPVGTKLWKQFSFGAPVETRYMERTAAGWRYATYVWRADATATLAPVRGLRGTAEVAAGIAHQIPSEADCRVCHGNGRSPVLGFSALQLSPDRDPAAVHREAVAADALDLAGLARRGLVRGYRGPTAPRIAARTPGERAALGYLHGNCGGCHHRDGALASLDMVLATSVVSGADAVLATTLGRASHVAPARARIAPGDPAGSVLLERMQSRAPVAQMPPLGTLLADPEAVLLIASWIDQLAH